TDAAFAIAGHHGGLPDQAGLAALIHGEGGAGLVSRIWESAKADCPELGAIVEMMPNAQAPPAGKQEDEARRLAFDLRIRLLFSCLVDADWLDSAAAVDPAAARQPTPLPERAEQWTRNLLDFIAQRAATCADPDVAASR